LKWAVTGRTYEGICKGGFGGTGFRRGLKIGEN